MRSGVQSSGGSALGQGRNRRQMAWSLSRNARLFALAGGAALSLGNARLGLSQTNGGPAGPRFVVVLDAAHGGEDGGGQVGASGGGTGEAEKTLTLALSVRLRSLLTARGFTVITTREGNVNLTADARAQTANHATASAVGGSACISLHASEAGTGVHIFVSSLAPGGTGRFLPWKTAQSAFIPRSLRLAGTVNSALEHTTVAGGGAIGAAGADSGPIPATLGRAALPGVDSMTCPAVAVEMAPIRGADRRVVTEVTDPEYQTQFVEALASALLAWKTDLETDGPRAGGSQP